MTVKFNRAAGNQAISTPDNAVLTYPATDFALCFVVTFDGLTTGDNPQYILANSPLGSNGSLNLIYNTSGAVTTSLRNKLQLKLNNVSGSSMVSLNNNVQGASYLFALQRSGTTLTLRRCPILTTSPVDGSAVVADGSITASSAYDGTAGMFIGARNDLDVTRACDQSLGRFFRFDGTLTDLEVARLAYGEEITALGKTPAWYVRLDTISDTADRGASALPFTVSGAPATSANQPGFGFDPTLKAPTITTLPVIGGAAQVGAAIGYTPGTVTGTAPITRTQQWRIDSGTGPVNITGATAATYTPVTADAGKQLSVLQTETNAQGADAKFSASVSVAAAGVANDLTLVLTNNSVRQRIGTAANVPVSGTYVGTVPTKIQRQIYAPDGVTIIQPWADVSGATIGGGAWSGTPSIGQGGPFRMAVRSLDGTNAVLATSAINASLFMVGALFASIGSSSSEKLFDSTSGTGFTPATNVRKFNELGWATFGTVGAAIPMANSLASQSNVPVGMLDYGVGGTYISTWLNKAGTAWKAFADGVIATGGKLEGVFLTVGSNDARDSLVVSQAQHLSNLRTLIANIREVAGQPTLPILLSGMNRRVLTNTDQANWVRMAEAIIGDDANVFHVQTMDFPLSGDGVHLTPGGFTNSGSRQTYVLGNALYNAVYKRGPKVTSIVFSGSAADITLTHRNGTDFTPATAIPFVTATDASGALTFTSIVRKDAATITATADRPIVAPLNLDYLSGGDPGTATQVFDNGAVPLPMVVETDLVATQAGAAAAKGSFTTHQLTSSGTIKAGQTCFWTCCSGGVIGQSVGEVTHGTTTLDAQGRLTTGAVLPLGPMMLWMRTSDGGKAYQEGTVI